MQPKVCTVERKCVISTPGAVLGAPRNGNRSSEIRSRKREVVTVRQKCNRQCKPFSRNADRETQTGNRSSRTPRTRPRKTKRGKRSTEIHTFAKPCKETIGRHDGICCIELSCPRTFCETGARTRTRSRFSRPHRPGPDISSGCDGSTRCMSLEQ